MTTRSGLQLLAGLLVVAGIPVVATAHILEENALRNARASADATLAAEAESARRTLARLADEASDRAYDVSRKPDVQRALLRRDRSALRRLARREAGISFRLAGRRVAGTMPDVAVTRSVSLALDGKPVATVSAAVALDAALERRLLRETRRAPGDRLLVVSQGRAVADGRRLRLDGSTVRLAGTRYRGVLLPVPNAKGVGLVALRPERTVTEGVRPYQQRVRYAAGGSFALLVLIGLLFGRPILRTLGEFKRVASQATTDDLTGLANRRSFDEELVLEWRRAERTGDPLALVLADLDDFKSVNDTHGHPVGDAVLRRVGEVLTEGVRHVDLAARYGGEEFAIVVPATDLEGAALLAERLRIALAETPVALPDGGELTVTASWGVAAKDGVERAEDLVARADEALYAAKRGGKNRVAPDVLPREQRAPKRVERRSPAAKRAGAKKTAPKKRATRTRRAG